MKGRWASKTQHVWVYPVRGLRVLGLGLGDGTRWAPMGIPECAPWEHRGPGVWRRHDGGALGGTLSGLHETERRV